MKLSCGSCFKAVPLRDSNAHPGERKRQSRKLGLTIAQEGSTHDESKAGGRQRPSGDDVTGQEGQVEPLVASAASRVPSITHRNDRLDDVIPWDMALLGAPSSPILLDFSCLADRESGTSSSAQPASSDEPSDQSLSSGLRPKVSADPMAWFGTLASPSLSSVDNVDYSFPDSYLLPVCELSLLKAFIRIAGRVVGDKAAIWDINATSPFSVPGPAASTSHLPQTWQPTTAQMLIPHHPLLDFLPWPSVREKIIRFLNLPEDMRPPAAQSPTALVQFAYDLEDGSEGVRIWGGDPYDPASWEVGQLLFERWWFIFDSQIIEQSNRWRDMRGAAKLRITGSARTGELWTGSM